MGQDFFAVANGPKRWANLVFVVGLLAVLLFAHDERLSTVWPYLVLIVLFILQLARPTLAGWVATLVCWTGAWILMFTSVPEIGLWIVLLFGILPLIVLILLRPTASQPTP